MEEEKYEKIKQELCKKIKKNEKKYNTPELALEYLIDLGVYDKDGQLTETYRD